MRTFIFRLASAVVVAILLAWTQADLIGQGSAVRGAQPGGSWSPPRAADGKPDLQGIWAYATITPLERPNDLTGKTEFATDEELAEFEAQTRGRRNQDTREGAGTLADVSRAYNDFWWDYGTRFVGKQTSLVVDPADGRIPALTPDAERRQAALAEARRQRTTDADNPEDRNLWERCITRTLPTLPGPYNNNIQIVQTRDSVVIMTEMIHEARVVPLDGRPFGTLRHWRGESRGKWDGDTLVVETKNFSDKTNFRGSGRNLHLVERYRRVDDDTLLYEVTISDPTTWTKPWTVSLPMMKNSELIYEYACHEANYGLQGIMKGSRAQDQANKSTGSRNQP
jgi:hypothetical protein